MIDFCLRDIVFSFYFIIFIHHTLKNSIKYSILINIKRPIQFCSNQVHSVKKLCNSKSPKIIDRGSKVLHQVLHQYRLCQAFQSYLQQLPHFILNYSPSNKLWLIFILSVFGNESEPTVRTSGEGPERTRGYHGYAPLRF